MTTFNPLASVVLSIAICSCFTLFPLSLSLSFSCLRQLYPAPPTSPRNPAQGPARPNSSPLGTSPEIAAANPSSPPCAPLQRHSLRAKAAQSKPRVAPTFQSFQAPAA